MKKNFLFIIAVFGLTLPVFAVCSVDSTQVCTIANDTAILRKPFKPMYQDYNSTIDYGSNPAIQGRSSDRAELQRVFRTQNEMQNTSNYDANCQLGVCLPSDMPSSIR